MNVLKSVQAFQQHREAVDPHNQMVERDGIPPSVFSVPPERLALLLTQATPEVEEAQERSNQEWTGLLELTEEPVLAASLVMDWLADRAQAVSEEENFADWERQPEATKQPYGDGQVP